MNISTIIEAFNEMCPTETTANHVDGNAPVILTKRSTLSKEEMENFLQEKLSALLDEIVEEMDKAHDSCISHECCADKSFKIIEAKK